MARRDFAPIHPGEVLLHDFMEPMGLSQYRVAKEIDVPARRINEIVHGKRAISADTALRLSRYFGLSDAYWLNLQGLYDLQLAKEQLLDILDSIEPVHSLAA
jgi:addiction module HigA family antidote